MLPTLSLTLIAHLFAGHPGDPSAPHQADDSLQCGNRLVTMGDMKSEVFVKCGSPAFQEKRTEVRQQGRTLVSVTVDVWTYNLGPYMFMRTLTFENGRLREIQASSQGK